MSVTFTPTNRGTFDSVIYDNDENQNVLSTDGTDDYATYVGTLNPDQEWQFSITAKMNTPSDHSILLNAGDYNYQLIVDSDGTIKFKSHDGSDSYYLSATTTTDGKYREISVKHYTDDTYEIIVDGTVENTDTLPDPESVSRPHSLAAQSGKDRYYYDTILSDFKVYNDGTLVTHYKIDEGSGDTLYDDSGNNNDGTIYGATWTTISTSRANRYPAFDKTNLKAYYPFAQGTGSTLYDESKNGNNGTIDGATWVWDSDFGWVLSGDGTDDYVNLPTLSLPNFTIIQWINLDQDKDWNTSFGAKKVISLMSYNDGTIKLSIGDGSDWKGDTDTGSNTTSPGNWQMWTGTYDGSTLKFFTDITEKDSISVSVSIPDSQHRIFHRYGRDTGGDYHMDGKCAYTLIFDTVLSQSEIELIYNKTKPKTI